MAMNFRQWTDEILAARKDRNLTHKELAAALGYSEKYLYNVLEGKSRSQKAALRISNFLGVVPYTYPTFDTCQRYAFDCVMLDGPLRTNEDKALAFIKTLVQQEETFSVTWTQISSAAACCTVAIVDPSEDYTEEYNALYRRGR